MNPDEEFEAIRADYVDAVLNPAKAQSYLMLLKLREQIRAGNPQAAIAPYKLVAVPPPPLPWPLRLLAVLVGESKVIVREGRL